MLSTVQIINKALSDIEYVRSLEGRLGQLVTEAYVRCLTYTHGEIVRQIASLHGMLTSNRCFTNGVRCCPLGGCVYQGAPTLKLDFRAWQDGMGMWQAFRVRD